jgi:hypothetical protein
MADGVFSRLLVDSALNFVVTPPAVSVSESENWTFGSLFCATAAVFTISFTSV